MDTTLEDHLELEKLSEAHKRQKLEYIEMLKHLTKCLDLLDIENGYIGEEEVYHKLAETITMVAERVVKHKDKELKFFDQWLEKNKSSKAQ